MLVTSSYKKNDIIGIKLSTGEEVVARFDKFDSSTKDKTLNIVKPTVLTLNPQNGQAMLIPWLMSLDAMSSEPVTVSQEQIVAIYKQNYLRKPNNIYLCQGQYLDYHRHVCQHFLM